MERLPAVLQLSQAVVTAALPSIVVASDINELLDKYSSEGYAGTFNNGVLSEIPEYVSNTVNQHLADAVVQMGIDLKTDYGLAILSGAIMTAIFIVYTAAVSNRSPIAVWQEYLSKAGVV